MRRRMGPAMLNAVVAGIDLLILNFATTAAFWLRFQSWPPRYNWLAYERLWPWESLTLLIVFYLYGLYHYTNKTAQEMRRALAAAVMLNGVFTLALTYLLMNIGFPRSVFLIATGLQLPLFGLWHGAHRTYVLRSSPAVPVLVIGPDVEWPALAGQALRFLPRVMVRCAAPEQVEDAALWDGVCAIVLGHVDPRTRERCFVTALAHNVPCFWPPDPYDVLVARADLTSLGDAPMFSLPTSRKIVLSPVTNPADSVAGTPLSGR